MAPPHLSTALRLIKSNGGGRVHVFQTWKKQVSKSVKLRLIDLTKNIKPKQNRSPY